MCVDQIVSFTLIHFENSNVESDAQILRSDKFPSILKAQAEKRSFLYVVESSVAAFLALERNLVLKRAFDFRAEVVGF